MYHMYLRWVLMKTELFDVPVDCHRIWQSIATSKRANFYITLQESHIVVSVLRCYCIKLIRSHSLDKYIRHRKHYFYLIYCCVNLFHMRYIHPIPIKVQSFLGRKIDALHLYNNTLVWQKRRQLTKCVFMSSNSWVKRHLCMNLIKCRHIQ